jgi:hypothetical protein
VVGGNLCGRKCERGWERRHYRECYADNHVWFSRLRSGQRRHQPTQSGALVVSGGAGIQGNVNVGGNAIILSDIE